MQLVAVRLTTGNEKGRTCHAHPSARSPELAEVTRLPRSTQLLARPEAARSTWDGAPPSSRASNGVRG